MLKSFFKHVGEADKNIWGYVMLKAFPPFHEVLNFSFQVLV